MMRITLRVERFDPGTGDGPRISKYQVEAQKGWTVLDALNHVKWNLDGSLTYRRSCRSGICGSCAMNINGVNGLACHTQIEGLRSALITLRPLPGFRVIKDLAVDLDPFWQKYEKVKPYLITYSDPPERERLQSPEERKRYDRATHCIMCASCTSSCPSTWTDPDYPGPAALTKAFRFIADSRDEGAAERLAVITEGSGLWRCHSVFNCVDACPKKIDTTQAIAYLKRRAVFAGPGARSAKTAAGD